MLACYCNRDSSRAHMNRRLCFGSVCIYCMYRCPNVCVYVYTHTESGSSQAHSFYRKGECRACWSSYHSGNSRVRHDWSNPRCEKVQKRPQFARRKAKQSNLEQERALRADTDEATGKKTLAAIDAACPPLSLEPASSFDMSASAMAGALSFAD